MVYESPEFAAWLQRRQRQTRRLRLRAVGSLLAWALTWGICWATLLVLLLLALHGALR